LTKDHIVTSLIDDHLPSFMAGHFMCYKLLKVQFTFIILKYFTPVCFLFGDT